MMKAKLKRLSALLCAVALASSLVACGGGEGNNSGGASGGGSEQATLKLWHIFGGDADPNKTVVDQITKEAEEKFNVKIEVDTAENEAYKTKLKAAIAANEAPDIMYTWGYGFVTPFVQANKLLALDEYFTDEYKSHLSDTTLTGFQFDGKTYALTTDQSVACMFYNQELFDQNGIEIPETFEEFVAACQAFIDKGITPLSVGGKESWTLAQYYDLFALRTVGSQGVKAAHAKETGYDDPGFKEAAEALRQLVDMGAFPEGSAGISREESEVPFLEGQTPIYLNGSWTAARVYKDSSKVADKIVARPGPTFANGKGTATDFTGGPDTGFAVSANTKDPKLAAEVAQFLAYEAAARRFELGSTLPAYKGVEVDETKVNPLLLSIYEMTQDATSYTIWWDNSLEGKDATVYLNKLQELFVGQLTPDQFVEELQKLNA